MTPKPTTPSSGHGLSRIPYDELEALQGQLRAYAGSLLGGAAEVEDLIQETNLYLLSNEGKYEPGTNFRAWAFTVVYYRVLAWRRDQQRSRTRFFSEETLEVIAREAEKAVDAEPRAEALQRCMGCLSPSDRELLEWKYVHRRSLSAFARNIGASENSLHQKVSRLRQALRLCIRKTLTEI